MRNDVLPMCVCVRALGVCERADCTNVKVFFFPSDYIVMVSLDGCVFIIDQLSYIAHNMCFV